MEMFYKGRKSGITESFLRYTLPAIHDGKRIGIAGCKDPDNIKDRFAILGVNVMYEPMIATGPNKLICDYDGPIGIEYGKKEITGYEFYKKLT